MLKLEQALAAKREPATPLPNLGDWCTDAPTAKRRTGTDPLTHRRLADGTLLSSEALTDQMTAVCRRRHRVKSHRCVLVGGKRVRGHSFDWQPGSRCWLCAYCGQRQFKSSNVKQAMKAQCFPLSPEERAAVHEEVRSAREFAANSLARLYGHHVVDVSAEPPECSVCGEKAPAGRQGPFRLARKACSLSRVLRPRSACMEHEPLYVRAAARQP